MGTAETGLCGKAVSNILVLFLSDLVSINFVFLLLADLADDADFFQYS